MSLINCEVNLILTWSENVCYLTQNTKVTTFAIIDTELYVPFITLSTQSNPKLLQKLRFGFIRTANWNKYEPQVSVQASKPYLDFLIEPSFPGGNRLFALSFENKDDRTAQTKYYLATVEMKDYNVIINGKNIFDHPVKNSLRTYDDIRKIEIGAGDDYTTSCLLHYNYINNYYKIIAIDLSKQQGLDCLLDYNYFNNYCKIITIDLSKQQGLDADPKAIQQINFTGNLVREGNANAKMLLIIEKVKENILKLSQETGKIL